MSGLTGTASLDFSHLDITYRWGRSGDPRMAATLDGRGQMPDLTAFHCLSVLTRTSNVTFFAYL